MTIITAAALAALGLLAGVMIGCIGIGGVILVPALTYLGGIPIQTAIAAAMMGYILSGVVATIVYLREEAGRWDMAAWLWAGAMPAALAGAWAANVLQPAVLEALIGCLIVFSGFHSLRQGALAEQENRKLLASWASALGGLTGFGSAVTGTGGPLVLVPMLIWLQLPVLTAIRLGQTIQLPIATLATIGNVIYGKPDLILGALLSVGLVLGTWLGARLSQVLPRAVLRRIVSFALLVIGTAIFGKLAFRYGFA